MFSMAKALSPASLGGYRLIAGLCTALLVACGGGDGADPSSEALSAGQVDAQGPSMRALADSSQWQVCAGENGRCDFTGSRLVRYGSSNNYVEKSFSNGADCTNANFGDPAPNVIKTCWIPAAPPAIDPTKWQACSAEHGRCSFSGSRLVRYGSPTAYVEKLFIEGTDCSNMNFGDPAPGIVKTCWIEVEAPVIVGANRNYTKGQWNYYGGMWSRFFDSRLTETTELSQAGGASNNYYVRASVPPSGFPNSWTQTWMTPSNYSYTRPGAPGVYGYLATSYCNYDNGSNNPAGCVQRQVDNIFTLTTEFSMVATALPGSALGDFNILHEFYLTSAPGNLDTKRLEVGVILHASEGGVRFHAGGTPIGVFTDRWGNSWTCVRNGTFVTFLRANGANLLSGAFDWREALTFLKSRGHVDGAWWFNGIAMGVEPTRNGGTLSIQRLAVTYQ